VRTPDTREAISKFLADRGLSPIHRRGQNFLVRPGALDRIVTTAKVAPSDVVLEVGPGCGGLTERLLATGARVVAAELDRGLADVVEELLGQEERLQVVRGDVMATKSSLAPDVLVAVAAGEADRPWKVVSNLPYQISSPFLSGCALLPTPPARLVVTVQREVGDVLMAEPGSDAYSPLSFLARLAWEVRRVEALPAAAFWPRPQVDSCVMSLDRGASRPVPLARSVALARRLFQRRRKALRGTLPDALTEVTGRPVADDALGRWLGEVGVTGSDRIDAVPPEAIEGLLAAAVRDS